MLTPTRFASSSMTRSPKKLGRGTANADKAGSLGALNALRKRTSASGRSRAHMGPPPTILELRKLRSE
jgi:hypothetical protein